MSQALSPEHLQALRRQYEERERQMARLRLAAFVAATVEARRQPPTAKQVLRSSTSWYAVAKAQARAALPPRLFDMIMPHEIAAPLIAGLMRSPA